MAVLIELSNESPHGEQHQVKIEKSVSRLSTDTEHSHTYKAQRAASRRARMKKKLSRESDRALQRAFSMVAAGSQNGH